MIFNGLGHSPEQLLWQLSLLYLFPENQAQINFIAGFFFFY